MTIKPYLISVEFDEVVEQVDNERWAISASVDIGNALQLGEARSFRNKLRGIRKIPKNASLNEEFIFVVCSPAFQANPTHEYAPGIQRAFTQKSFNKEKAIAHLKGQIDAIGTVTLEVFDTAINKFLFPEDFAG